MVVASGSSGAPLAAGSDWPVTTPDPLEAIRVAAGQHPHHGTTHTILARNLLDVNAMLTAYTAGSARVNGRAGVTGRIAPGFLADLAVLSVADLRAPEALREAMVVETRVAGELADAREQVFVAVTKDAQPRSAGPRSVGYHSLLSDAW